jgi:TatD DNase family protein
MYIDTHAHFDLMIKEGADSEDFIISQLSKKNISSCVQVATDNSSCEWSRQFAGRYSDKGILFTAGIHPSSQASIEDLEAMVRIVDNIMSCDDKNLLFAIGECGLDYYRMKIPKNEQIASFEFQLSIAKKHKLPVIIHSRDSFDDTISIIKDIKPEIGILHCFSGGKDRARTALDHGLYCSFAGNLTYPKALDIQEAASYMPAYRLLIETDAPFLTPVPLRGRKNRPDYIVHTYDFIAGLRNANVHEIAASVSSNFNKIREGL